MNALFTYLRERMPRGGGRGRTTTTRRRNSPTFSQPSVTVTTTTTRRRRQHGNANDNNTLDDNGEQQQEQDLSFLYQLCKRWAWPAVIFRTQRFPQEATVGAVDGNGDTVLHWTCFGSPPMEAVEALLDANPKLAQMANHRGNLPLHVACSYRASSDIIRLLVQTYPDSVNVANDQGSYPLHILCDYGCSVDSIRAILQVSVQTISLQDGVFRRKPLVILNERKNMHEFHDCLHTLRMANALGDYRTLPGLTKDTLLARCRRMVFWKKASLLILAEHSKQVLPAEISENKNDDGGNHEHDNNSGSTDDDNNEDDTNHPTTGIVHACLQIQRCPPALLEFAVLVHAHELLLPDATGRLPLHVAVERCNVTTIMDILNADPKAARIPSPPTPPTPQKRRINTTTTTTTSSKDTNTNNDNQDSENRNYKDNGHKFPIQVLLERFPDSSWAGVVNSFVSANPLALESLNLDRRFYSLIWAKLVVNKDFDSIFESIRGNPMLLGSTTSRGRSVGVGAGATTATTATAP